MKFAQLLQFRPTLAARMCCAALGLSLMCLTTVAMAAEETEPLRYPGKTKRDALQRSSEQLTEWIKADPTAAATYVGVADVQIFLWCYGFELHSDSMPRCEEAVRQAIELDPDLAAAHTALGVVLLGQRDWKAAERELRLAIELEPNRAASLHWYALYLAAMGRHDEAEQYSQRSAELDSSSGMTIARSSILYFKRDWQGMIDVLTPTIEQDDQYEAAYDWLGMAYVQQERFDLAIPTYRRAAELADGLAEVLGGLGHAYALAGREPEAREVLEKMYRLAERWHVPPVQIAFVHVGLGEKQQALDLLERAYAQRSWELVFMQVEPWLDDLREEPRFIRLQEKMGFPE